VFPLPSKDRESRDPSGIHEAQLGVADPNASFAADDCSSVDDSCDALVSDEIIINIEAIVRGAFDGSGIVQIERAAVMNAEACGRAIDRSSVGRRQFTVMLVNAFIALDRARVGQGAGCRCN